MNPLLGANLAWVLSIAATLAVNITALIVIPRGRKPTAAMAWLLLIVLLPVLGILLYLLLGSVRLPKGRMQEQQRITALYRSSAGAAGRDAPLTGAPAWLARWHAAERDPHGSSRARGQPCDADRRLSGLDR